MDVADYLQSSHIQPRLQAVDRVGEDQGLVEGKSKRVLWRLAETYTGDSIRQLQWNMLILDLSLDTS